MLPAAFIIRLAIALGCSLAALAGCGLLQLLFLFPDEFGRVVAREPMAFRSILPSPVSDELLLIYSIYPWHPPARDLSVISGCYRPSAALEGRFFPRLESPYREMAVAQSGVCFLASYDGHLYRANLGDSRPAPVLIGQSPKPTGDVTQLQCSDDGSLVVMIDVEPSCWNISSGQLLWQLPAKDLLCCCFVPGTHRLLGGNDAGQVFELDSSTGRRIRLLADFRNTVIKISVSPDQRRVAALDKGANYCVVDLLTGKTLWSARARYCGTAEFMPDSQRLLVTNTEFGIGLAMLQADTGELIAPLVDGTALVGGLAVTRDEKAFVVMNSGSLTEIDLRRCCVVRRYQLALNPKSVVSRWRGKNDETAGDWHWEQVP